MNKMHTAPTKHTHTHIRAQRICLDVSKRSSCLFICLFQCSFERQFYACLEEYRKIMKVWNIALQVLLVSCSMSSATAFAPARRTIQQAITMNPPVSSVLKVTSADITQSNTSNDTRRCSSRRSLLSSSLTTLVVALTFQPQPSHAGIAPCPVTRNHPNCVSTASVKNVAMYAPPWTYRGDQILARLKGSIAEDPTLTLTESTDHSLLVTATRQFGTDEMEFFINDADRVITFRSRQVEGPDLSDFGAQRKRLDEIRRRVPGLEEMGAEFASADTAPREGAWGQLKAFYGIQRGTGYEDIILEEDD